MAICFREARKTDVAAIVRLLADDRLSMGREHVSDPPDEGYLRAFETIAAEPRMLLAVADDDGQVVGTLQLTVVPGLSNQGSSLALISAVRIAANLRGQGLGRRLVEWAMDEARARGCRIVELLTHNSRTDAQRFYESLGFEKSHAGMRRRL